MSKLHPLASLFADLKNEVLLKASLTFSLFMIFAFLIKNTFPASAILEMSILQPTQPARLLFSFIGGLLMMISDVKNCFGIIKNQ